MHIYGPHLEYCAILRWATVSRAYQDIAGVYLCIFVECITTDKRLVSLHGIFT
jgi:hypothetical protein